MSWSMSERVQTVQTHRSCIAQCASGRRGLLRAAAVLVSGWLLAGCASGFHANVTSFQKWPADAAGQTYRIIPGDGQHASHLEYQAVADMVRANIGSTGLVEAAGDQSARFHVHLRYDNPITQLWTQRYADDPWFLPYGAYHGRRFGWGGGLLYAPRLVSVPVQVHQNTLTLWMTDQRDGGTPGDDVEVYRATAMHLSENDQRIAVMPYLVQAIFDGFPGNNGQVRQVTYDLPQ